MQYTRKQLLNDKFLFSRIKEILRENSFSADKTNYREIDVCMYSTAVIFELAGLRTFISPGNRKFSLELFSFLYDLVHESVDDMSNDDMAAMNPQLNVIMNYKIKK